MIKSVLGMAIALAGLAFPALAESRPADAAHAPWWTHAVIYEIYPRSFQDSNGDGVGDLKGVTRRLDYLKDLGVDAIWLTPFYPSPNFDFGYDVANYTDVAPEYGTMADWDHLVAEARKRGIRVLVDFVLNHTSDQHAWFRQSRSSRTDPRRDWYVWKDPAPDGGPPTNWKSIFGGSTWQFDQETGQYYYHVFLPQQPDLNYNNPGVRQAMNDVLRFWLDHGASGFRLDATPYLFEDPAWPQDPDPASGNVGLKPYNAGQPANHTVLRDMRSVVDSYGHDKVMLGENAIATIEDLAKVYGAHGDEINLPMDFLYADMKKLDAGEFKRQIDDAETRLGGQPPVVFFSNHDRPRSMTKFGDGQHDMAIARLTAAVTLTVRGTALMYYGEELGMADLPADVLKSLPLGPNRKVADNRDPVRSPMQWTAAPKAGFTTGKPWLPVNANATTRNAETEAQDPTSLYRWYRSLLDLRHTNSALREGAYVPLQSGNPKVLAYARIDQAGHGALIVLNMSDAPQQAHISGWAGIAPTAAHTLLASPDVPVPSLSDPALAPYGVQVLGFSAH